MPLAAAVCSAGSVRFTCATAGAACATGAGSASESVTVTLKSAAENVVACRCGGVNEISAWPLRANIRAESRFTPAGEKALAGTPKDSAAASTTKNEGRTNQVIPSPYPLTGDTLYYRHK